MSSLNVLIVDDSRLTRNIIRNILASNDFNIIDEAVNGKEAIEKTKKLKPDLVTIDLTMPELGGMESIQSLIQAYPPVKVLVVTALGGQKLLQEDAKKAGAHSVLTKPFTPEKLLTEVNTIFKKTTKKDPKKNNAFNFNLGEDQVEHLMEVANIGAGNAASEISDLIDERCLISLPQVSYVNQKNLADVLDMKQSYMAILHIKIMDDIPANILVVIKRDYAHMIIKHMTKKAFDSSTKDLTFTAQYTLKEMGEILTKSFSKAINEFLLSQISYVMPDITLENWTTSADDLISKNSNKDSLQFMIHSSFSNSNKSFEGRFIFLFNEASQRTILDRVELLLGN